MDKELGVFLTNIKTEPTAAKLEAAAKMGFTRIQVGKLPDEFYTPSGAERFRKLLGEQELEPCAVTIVFDGEIYKSWASVQDTCGLLLRGFLKERMAYSRACIDFAERIGSPLVTFHMGVLPETETDPGYEQLLRSVGELALYAATRGVTIGLETGQETSEAMLGFLHKLALDNVGINFDNANVVLYGTEDPIAALEALAPYVVGVHVKDGLRPEEDRGALGKQVPIGQGHARVRELLARLAQIGYDGPLVIEDYAGQWDQELPRAKRLVEAWLSDL